ncbi:MAG TPA: tetratricopeptide repeat protein [Opitutus sp.]|nr:tetratricopeptide repeat protein [Opitutus sp.]
MNERIQSILQQAVAAHRAGRRDEARLLYERVLAAAPANFDALHLSGLLAHQSGRHGEAVDRLARALRRQPKSAVCAMRLAAARHALGDEAAAEQDARVALARQPDLLEAWNVLAAVLQAQGRLDEARQACERALVLEPGNLDALERAGAIVAATKGVEAAEPWFRRIVAAAPQSVPGWINLGIALAMTHRATEALPCFDRALTLAPGHAQALAGRAVALERNYDLRGALANYAAALARDPAHHEARSARLLALHYPGDVSPTELADEHRAFGAALAAVSPAVLPPITDARYQPLRVAIVSPDLRTHAVAQFLAPLLEHLDRTRLEVILYHDHAIVDETSRRLRTLAADWRHTAGLPADAFEELVRADAPDIAIDLAGHTAGNRLPVFARRLAPLQVSYLGYPNTTGLATMDFRLTDEICDPPGQTDEWHTERLVRFAPTAWAWQPPAEAPEVAPRPATEEGAPFTFGCFNNFAKVSDETLRGWAGVLAVVPGSRLLLKNHGLSDPALRARQAARFAACGIDPERVEFLERTPGLREHLATYARVDVALDTFPYHGTTTTCEALWMGVPVVTRWGEHHAARVGASLLMATRHRKWIALDWSDYAQIAAEFAADPAWLAEISGNLRDDLRSSPLLDHAGQAARFGDALLACWSSRVKDAMAGRPVGAEWGRPIALAGAA